MSELRDWFVHDAARVRCECGARFRNRSGLAAHVRLEAQLAPAIEREPCSMITCVHPLPRAMA